ncbi:hypothetical protein AUSSIE_32 [Sinorhizobium phage Aussie]|nr:hypothetical protein AUSSIE_32 [Sinorhizobium phage Aussie]
MNRGKAMFKKFAFGSLIVVALATSAHAQEKEAGWGVDFNRDTFDKTVAAEASVAEDGDALSKALITVTCGGDGSLIPTFWPGRSFISPTSYKVEFKSPSAQKTFTFTSGEVPRMGKRLRLEAEEATALLDLFTNSVEPVAFRGEEGQGRFSSIAAREVFDIVRTSCPK